MRIYHGDYDGDDGGCRTALATLESVAGATRGRAVLIRVLDFVLIIRAPVDLTGCGAAVVFAPGVLVIGINDCVADAHPVEALRVGADREEQEQDSRERVEHCLRHVLGGASVRQGQSGLFLV